MNKELYYIDKTGQHFKPGTTTEEIDAEIQRVCDENKGNFCFTFEIIEIYRIERMREELLKKMSLKEDQPQSPQPPQPLEDD